LKFEKAQREKRAQAAANGSEKKGLSFHEQVAKADAEAKIGEDGRVLIRPSGTEPLVRVMIEGKDTEVINELAEDLAALISRKFH